MDFLSNAYEMEGLSNQLPFDFDIMSDSVVSTKHEHMDEHEYTASAAHYSGDVSTRSYNREYRISNSEAPVLELGNLNELDVLTLLNDQGVTADMPRFDLDENVVQTGGIVANDIGSLLEQFEQVSNTITTMDQLDDLFNPSVGGVELSSDDDDESNDSIPYGDSEVMQLLMTTQEEVVVDSNEKKKNDDSTKRSSGQQRKSKSPPKDTSPKQPSASKTAIKPDDQPKTVLVNKKKPTIVDDPTFAEQLFGTTTTVRTVPRPKYRPPEERQLYKILQKRTVERSKDNRRDKNSDRNCLSDKTKVSQHQKPAKLSTSVNNNNNNDIDSKTLDVKLSVSANNSNNVSVDNSDVTSVTSEESNSRPETPAGSDTSQQSKDQDGKKRILKILRRTSTVPQELKKNSMGIPRVNSDSELVALAAKATAKSYQLDHDYCQSAPGTAPGTPPGTPPTKAKLANASQSEAGEDKGNVLRHLLLNQDLAKEIQKLAAHQRKLLAKRETTKPQEPGAVKIPTNTPINTPVVYQCQDNINVVDMEVENEVVIGEALPVIQQNVPASSVEVNKESLNRVTNIVSNLIANHKAKQSGKAVKRPVKVITMGPGSPQSKPPPLKKSADRDPGRLYNKLPGYCNSLSTTVRQSALSDKETFGSRAFQPPPESSSNSSVVSSQPLVPRGVPPPKAPLAPSYNKVPAYFSCFTNSTRYDGDNIDDFVLDSRFSNKKDPLGLETSESWPTMPSSRQSSVTNSPTRMVIDTRANTPSLSATPSIADTPASMEPTPHNSQPATPAMSPALPSSASVLRRQNVSLPCSRISSPVRHSRQKSRRSLTPTHHDAQSVDIKLEPQGSGDWLASFQEECFPTEVAPASPSETSQFFSPASSRSSSSCSTCSSASSRPCSPTSSPIRGSAKKLAHPRCQSKSPKPSRKKYPNAADWKRNYRRRGSVDSVGSVNESVRSPSRSPVRRSRSPRAHHIRRRSSRSSHRSRAERAYSSQSRSSSRSMSRSPGRCKDRSIRRYRGHHTHRRTKSRTRSRSPVRSRSRSRSTFRNKYRRQQSRSVSRERRIARSMERRAHLQEKKTKEIEERRIVYIGRIEESMTKMELRQKFERFGVIEEVSVHFRQDDVGDHYGFVTFSYACDAFAAIDKAKQHPDMRRYDLCFGGRRQFCGNSYADLDGNNEIAEDYGYTVAPSKPGNDSDQELDFDELLRQASQGISQKHHA